MSDKTSIEWTDRTWNPLTGCTKVSPGCDHCYAKTMHERFHGPGSFDTVELHPGRLDQPKRWRDPARVFVNSMSDLFHQDVSNQYIAAIFEVMSQTPKHTYQILTKRPARMRSLLTRWQSEVAWLAEPLPNVWLGVSVEDQHWANLRIPALLHTPAAVRFISAEPLLGPIDLLEFIDPSEDYDDEGRKLLDWVIVGGESGPGARPMDPAWVRLARNQCRAAGVPFLFKQWGEHRWISHAEGGYKRVGKKAAGRELDGRTWDEYPAPINERTTAWPARRTAP